MLNLLASIAPNLIGAISGGLVGAAQSALKNVGIELPENSKNHEKELEKIVANADPAMLAKIRQADNDFKMQMGKMQLDMKKLNNEDTSSAREMQTLTKSKIVPFLAVISVFTIIPIFCILFVKEIPPSNKDTLVFIIGQVTGWAGAVYTFYFGSSNEAEA